MVQDANFIRESIHFLHHYFKKSIQKEAEKFDITVPQMRVIKEVATQKKTNIKTLTKNLNMTQSTVSDIVERLIKKGILMKMPNPVDKRSVEIFVADSVKEFIEDGQFEYMNRTIMNTLALLEPADQKTVVQGMKLLMSAVQKELEMAEDNDQS